MKTPPSLASITSSLSFLFLLALPLAGHARPAIPPPSGADEIIPASSSPPEGLARSDWSGIRSAHAEWKHRFRQEEDGSFSARNAGQQWTTAFDGRGFLARPDHGAWEWGLELRGYGLGTERVAVDSGAEGVTGSDAGTARLIYRRDANLEEWFRNDSRGLEQGWTLAERPAGPAGEKLTLDLAVRGDLRPEAAGSSRAVKFVDRSGAAALTYGGLKAWDAEGRDLEARFVPSETSLRIEIDERGAVYPVTIDPVAQQAYLKAFNPGEDDKFGARVAVSGDTVVVGAHWESGDANTVNGDDNDNAIRAGAAYVFVRSGGTWSQQAYLKASNSNSFDEFGISVDVDGDTVVVGAFFEDSDTTEVNGPDNDNSTNTGAAYVFVRNGETWSQQAYLKASNAESQDRFGQSVAVDGDTVVVGASEEDSDADGVDGDQNSNDASNAGAAYVFVRNGTDWSQEAYLKASNSDANDRFSFDSVTVSGDTVVVGAPWEDSNATGIGGDDSNNDASLAGAAYVFVRDGTTWSQQAYVKGSNTEAGDKFGHAVAVDSDTMLIGASDEDSAATGVNGDESDNSASNSGAAYVFVRSGTAWTQQTYLKASNTGSSDFFGRTVGLSGDTAVIRAHAEDSSATGVDGDGTNNDASNSGAAYVFTRSGTAWSQRAYLKASNTGAGDEFGISVDVDGDTVVVGARNEDSNATGVDGDGDDNSVEDAGAAYVFLITPEPPAPVTAAPDTVRPRIRFLKRSRLRNPRPRHRIVGRAQDNVAVATVEVRVRGKGWRRAKLRGERWIFRTPRLESGRRNVFKVRAEDTSGNRSRPKRVRVTGK